MVTVHGIIVRISITLIVTGSLLLSSLPQGVEGKEQSVGPVLIPNTDYQEGETDREKSEFFDEETKSDKTDQASAALEATTVTGTVIDSLSKKPLPDARVMIEGADTHKTVVSEEGHFVLDDIAVDGSYQVITLHAHAEGYGSWKMEHIVLIPEDERHITVEMANHDVVIQNTLPRAISGHDQQREEEYIEPQLLQRGAASSNTTEIPDTIRVAVTGYVNCWDWLDDDQPVQEVVEMNFQDYVKNVLPNEWLSSWEEDSLKAGAMAVKTFAWRKVNVTGRAYLKDKHDLSVEPDVVDNTCDQVYRHDADRSDERFDTANKAVEDTWDYRMLKDGALVLSYYRAYESQCDPVNEDIPYSCMSQWGSQEMAEEGSSWKEILDYYYQPTEISRYRYLSDVPSDHVFYSVIDNLMQDGVINGYPDGTFRPDDEVSRAEMAKFVVNALGIEENTSCSAFSDVPEDHVFYTPIMNLKCNGIVTGFEDGSYKPDAFVTRGQATKFLVEGLAHTFAAGETFLYTGKEVAFSDVDNTHVFYRHIMTAYEKKILSGYEDGSFQPDITITRGAMAKMVDFSRSASTSQWKSDRTEMRKP
jgi:hypothetical protein